MSIGNRIVILQNSGTLFCYDVDKDEWSEESCEITKDLEDFSVAKLPWY